MLAIDFYKRNNENVTLKMVELILRHKKIDINIKYEKIIICNFNGFIDFILNKAFFIFDLEYSSSCC